METQRVWVSSDDLGWACAIVLSSENDDYHVKTNDGKQYRVKKDKCVLISSQNSTLLDDMIEMSELHEAIILNNLKQRYNQDKIYTYIGPMIVSINPFKNLDIYDHKTLPLYQLKPREQLPPHLYAIAHKAYTSLVEQGESQSMVISGESGAGKTEATKYILRYLSNVASNGETDQDGLSRRILATNPILEAFGNAKTQRNHNSSRFGKFIKISLSRTGQYLGATINNYLLEKTRVVYQAPDERNYHVFYQLLVGASPVEVEKYQLLDSVKSYRYMTNGDVPVQRLDDGANFFVLKQAFKELGIDEEEMSRYFSLLSAILHIGNIEFDGEEENIRLADDDQVRRTAELLCISQDLLREILTSRAFSAAGMDACRIPFRYEQAIENRDAMAKALYSRLFDHLIKRCNDCIGGNDKQFQNSSLFIGVLDIYGFENLQENSLEQFCINYANEKLHQQFIENMFKAEQEQYQREGVEWTNIEFVDNQACINLIEKANGILAIMDEEAKVPKANDRTLIDKLSRKHRPNPSFAYDDLNPDYFGVRHFASTVPYCINGFLEKNKDTLQDDVCLAMTQSTSPLIRQLFPISDSNPSTPHHRSSFSNRDGIDTARESSSVTPRRSQVRKNSVSFTPSDPRRSSRMSIQGSPISDNMVSPRGDYNKGVTVCRKFQNDLLLLIEILSSSNRHYIRCIKPNDKGEPNDFDQAKILNQLRSNGILETVKLRKAGYSRRIPYQAFHERFRVLDCSCADPTSLAEFLQRFDTSYNNINGLHQHHNNKLRQWAVGISQVFLRDGLVNKLESARATCYDRFVTTLQKYFRRCHAIQVLEKLRHDLAVRIFHTTRIQSYVRVNLARKEMDRLEAIERQIKESSCKIIQKYIYRYNAMEYIGMLKLQFDETYRYKCYVQCQCYIRRYIAMSHLNHMKLSCFASITIQRYIRCVRAQYTYETLLQEAERKRKKKELKRIEEEQKRRNEEEDRRKRKLDKENRIGDELRRREEEFRRLEEEKIRFMKKEEEERQKRTDEFMQKIEEEKARLMSEEVERKKKHQEELRLLEEEREMMRKKEEERQLQHREEMRRLDDEWRRRQEEARRLDEERQRRAEETRIQGEEKLKTMKKDLKDRKKQYELAIKQLEEQKETIKREDSERKKLLDGELKVIEAQAESMKRKEEELKKKEESKMAKLKQKQKDESEKLKLWMETERTRLELEYKYREEEWVKRQEERIRNEKENQSRIEEDLRRRLSDIENQYRQENLIKEKLKQEQNEWMKQQRMILELQLKGELELTLCPRTIAICKETHKKIEWGIFWGGFGIGIGVALWGLSNLFISVFPKGIGSKLK